MFSAFPSSSKSLKIMVALELFFITNNEEKSFNVADALRRSFVTPAPAPRITSVPPSGTT
jgi:hypothetical protein